MARPIVENHYGAYLVRGQLYQYDYEWPGLARSLGWNLARVQRVRGAMQHLARLPSRATACLHLGTDGTVDCRDCGVTASEFIRAAAEYLDAR
jgi:hypothetical protein